MAVSLFVLSFPPDLIFSARHPPSSSYACPRLLYGRNFHTVSDDLICILSRHQRSRFGNYSLSFTSKVGTSEYDDGPTRVSQ